MRVTTFPRSLQTPSPARSWNWQIFDHNPAECDSPDFFGSNSFRAIAHDRRSRSSQRWNSNDLDTYADDLTELIEELGLHDIVLVGHSTGGGEVTRYIGATARRASPRSCS